MLNFVLNDEILTRVNKCKYLGHGLSEDLSDDDDMARQYKKMYAQGNALIRKCYMCTGDVKCTLLNRTVLHYIHVSYGIIINRNQLENYV